MQKLKNTVYKIYHDNYTIFIVFFLIVLLKHLFISLGTGDDVYFFNSPENQNMFQFLTFRYNFWSSRLIIEFFLAWLTHLPLLWIILDSVIDVLTIYSICRIFSFTEYFNLKIFLFALYAMISPSVYANAGWMATTLNYSWCLSLGLVSVIPIVKIINYKNIKWYEYILYFFTLLYSTNQEQMCVIMLVTHLVTIFYLIIRKQKLHWFILLQTLVNIISIIFILTCPGNKVRSVEEEYRFFPDFSDLPLFRKLEMGFSSSLMEFLMKPNLIFFLFSLLLFIYTIINNKNLLLKWISFIPLVTVSIFGIFSPIFGNAFVNLINLKNSLTQYGTGITPKSPVTFLPDIILITVSLCLVFSVYKVFNNSLSSLISIFIILLGFCSRIIMSFTPTIWGTGERSFLFMYFSIIICACLIYKEFLKCEFKTYKSLYINIVYFLSILAVLNNLVTCFLYF